MQLKDFLVKKMKMTGPYQPVVIRALLRGNGKADLKAIAQDLAQMDPEMLDYYLSKLKNYPKKVLKEHDIAEIPKGKSYYKFMEGVEFSEDEVKELIKICEKKITDWYDKNPNEKADNSGWGLKRVKLITKYPYCALCGSRPPDVELDIDHIIPRDKGGTDDDGNLQVLCHKCNRAKGNYLLNSAEQTKKLHLNPDKNCVFCNLEEKRKHDENDYVISFKDGYPVSKGHMLIIPRRHIESPRDLFPIEINNLFEMAKKISCDIQQSDSSVKGFTIGFNDGEAAGQTVFHAHLHVIPRRKSDTTAPRGGIRNVISGKGNW